MASLREIVKLTKPQQRLLQELYDVHGRKCQMCSEYEESWLNVEKSDIVIAKNLQKKQLVVYKKSHFGINVTFTKIFWDCLKSQSFNRRINLHIKKTKNNCSPVKSQEALEFTNIIGG